MFFHVDRGAGPWRKWSLCNLRRCRESAVSDLPKTAIYSNRLGCFSSILLSLIGTLLLMGLVYVLNR
jgi:hypothetical protein